MTNLLIIAGLTAVLVGCAVAYGRVQKVIKARNAADRRAHLKDNARRL